MTVVPILLYHRISDRASDRFAVAPQRFAEHLAAIVDSGRTPVSVSEVADGLRGARALPERPVAITFDDGYADTPRAVAAVGDAGLRATVYVTTGMVDRPVGLSSDQVRGLGDLGATVELGAHTVSHPRLDEMAPDDALREITDSKSTLASIIDKPVQTFAYPHGAYDSRSRELVIQAGFQSAAAVKNALSHAGDDPWAVARWTVLRNTSAAHIGMLLDGHHRLAWPGERLQTRAFRLARRTRRRLRGQA